MPPASRSRGSTEGTDDGRRTRKNASRSCASCRRRRVKCSGELPCSACQLYHEDCTYEGKSDGRKPQSKSYVSALEQRVKELEALLGAHTTMDSPADTDVSLGLSQLKVDDDGEYRLYGYASPLMHLPAAEASPAPQALPGTFLCPDSGVLHTQSSFLYPESGLPQSHSENGSYRSASLDWSRNLPHDPAMTRQLHDDLLAAYFAYYNSWSCFVDEEGFRRDFASTASTHDYSALLHNSILALAAAFSPVTVNAELYSEKAKTFIEQESEAGLLSSVSGLLLLAEYHAGAARQKIGFLYFGIAHFSGSNLGLAVSLAPLQQRGLVDKKNIQQRQRVFCTWMIQDKLWSCFLGRQPSLLSHTTETELPDADENVDQQPWRASLDPASDTPAVPCNRAACLNATARLAGILERILTLLYPFRARLYAPEVIAQVSAFHVELERWHAELPVGISISPYAQTAPPNHIITLHATYWFVSALCHRPYYSPRSTVLPVNTAAVEHCERAASKIVNLLELHRKAPGLRYCHITLTQPAFLAGTIHLLAAINGDPALAPKRHATAISATNECIRALEEMGASWKCATQSAGILKRLMAEWTSKVTSSRLSAATDRSRPADVDMHSSRDLHRNAWDSFIVSDAQMSSIPAQTAPVPQYPPPPPPPISFGRYQPPGRPAPTLAPTYSQQATWCPTPVAPSTCSPPSAFDMTSEASINAADRYDPFATDDILLFSQQDGFSMPGGGWVGPSSAPDELPQWLLDLGRDNS